MQAITIEKSTGEREAFDPAKLSSSLAKAGANPDTIKAIVKHVEGELVDGMTTTEIYRHAFLLLHKKASHIAAKYSLKRAVAALGPNGFPFEKFVAEIFRAKGYEAVTDQIVQGGCVEHELDVVAWKGDELIMVEAKFHNEQGLKSDLKVALYIKARFDDLKGQVYIYGDKERKMSKGLLVTNTKFTDHAIRYAECQKLNLIGWNYPLNGNLEDLIIESKLHPLTCLTTLSEVDKQNLLKGDLVLCKHVVERKDSLSDFGISKDKTEAILKEAALVCIS